VDEVKRAEVPAEERRSSAEAVALGLEHVDEPAERQPVVELEPADVESEAE
jgi:hypothetical protein